MRVFFICFATMLFLISELIGLMNGLPTVTLLVRSSIIFVVFFVTGELFCFFWDRSKPEVTEDLEQDVSSFEAADQPELDTKKEALRNQASADPKKTAHVINTLISQ